MSLNNVNIFSKDKVQRLHAVMEFDTPITKDIYTFFKAIGNESMSVIEYPCFGGDFAALFNHHVGIDRVKNYLAMDFRGNFVAKAKPLAKQIHFQVKDVLIDESFRPRQADVLLSVGYLDNVSDPIGFIKQLTGKVIAKNIFITFPIAPEGKGQDLEVSNERVAEMFSPAGRFIQNRYSEDAVKQIANAVGLEFRIVRTNSSNEAILYKLDVVQQENSLPIKKVIEKSKLKARPSKKPTKKKINK